MKTKKLSQVLLVTMLVLILSTGIVFAQEGNSNPQGYSIEQAISDQAQSTTIAFDALAFLTGNLGADSFFPPGKVADFWGFQYLRDTDPSGMGHNTDFLTSAALNMLSVMTPEQRTALITLAESQVDDINDYAYMRFALMDAFRGLLESESTTLNEEAVRNYSSELYRLDGEISYERAQVMGGIIYDLDDTQRAYLDSMAGSGMLEWPDVEEPADLRDLDRDTRVAVMTYAGDIFSWYAGSLEADVYFCPERQGTYFGAFYMKDAPAVGNPGYNIGTNITADMGSAFLQALTPEQENLITSLVDIQRPYLTEIVDVREQVAIELRKFMTGEAVDEATVLSLMEKYGELDGAIVYNYAENFAQVNETLSDDQMTQLHALREELLGELQYPSGAYLYSHEIPMPEISYSDSLSDVQITPTGDVIDGDQQPPPPGEGADPGNDQAPPLAEGGDPGAQQQPPPNEVAGGPGNGNEQQSPPGEVADAGNTQPPPPRSSDGNQPPPNDDTNPGDEPPPPPGNSACGGGVQPPPPNEGDDNDVAPPPPRCERVDSNNAPPPPNDNQ